MKIDLKYNINMMQLQNMVKTLDYHIEKRMYVHALKRFYLLKDYSKK